VRFAVAAATSSAAPSHGACASLAANAIESTPCLHPFRRHIYLYPPVVTVHLYASARAAYSAGSPLRPARDLQCSESQRERHLLGHGGARGGGARGHRRSSDAASRWREGVGGQHGVEAQQTMSTCVAACESQRLRSKAEVNIAQKSFLNT
jgi:hypothetical protein